MSDGINMIYSKAPSVFTDYINKVYSKKEVINFYYELERKIRADYKDCDIASTKRLKKLEDCLNSLQYFLFTANRFGCDVEETYNYSDYTFGNQRPYTHHISLNGTGSEYRFTPSEMYFDFQSLILESSAILDKLTVCLLEIDDKYNLEKKNTKDINFVTNSFNRLIDSNNSDKVISESDKIKKRFCKVYSEKGHFSNFKNRLMKNNLDDEANSILKVFEECSDGFENILINSGSGGILLRNELAHNKNILELNQDLFCVYVTDKGKLYLDHIVNDLPLVATAQKLINSTTYLFVNTLSILFDFTPYIKENKLKLLTNIKLEDFETNWKNFYVDYREFHKSGKSKIKLITTQTTKSMIEISESEFDEEILNYSINT